MSLSSAPEIPRDGFQEFHLDDPEGYVDGPFGHLCRSSRTGLIFKKYSRDGSKIGWEEITSHETTIRRYQADTTGTANVASQFAVAFTVNDEIVLPRGTYRFMTDFTLPAGKHLVFQKGAVLLIDSGVTLTINGTLDAGNWQIFSGDGTVALGTGVAPSLNVKWWGAKGDDATDDTAAVGKALSAVPDYSELAFNGIFRVGSLVFQDKTKVTLRGFGLATLRLTGTGSGLNYSGLQLAGNLTKCEIRDLGFIGDGQTASNHGAIWSNGGEIQIQDLVIENCTIEHVVVGIVLSGITGDDSFNAIIKQNRIEDVVGTNTGQGYGIAVSLGAGQTSRTVISHNVVRRAQRHSIYWSVGGMGSICNNEVIEHRHGLVNPGFTLGAIVVVRSGQVTLTGNLIENHNDTGLEIGSDNGNPQSSVTVVANQFRNPQGEYADILIGQSNPASTGSPTNISIVGNCHERDGLFHSPIEFYCGKNVAIVANTFRITNAIGNTAPLHFILQGEGAGTATYTDNVVYANNVGYLQGAGTNYGVIFDATASASGIGVAVSGNRIEGVSQFFRFLAAQTNGNITVSDNNPTGWTPTASNTPSRHGVLSVTGTISAGGVIDTTGGLASKLGSAPSGTGHFFLQTTNGLNRISLGLIGNETGSNAGSDLGVFAYDDAGAFLGMVARFSRAQLVQSVGVALAWPELGGEPSAIADSAVLFAIDNGSGKTQLKIRYPGGASVVLDTEP